MRRRCSPRMSKAHRLRARVALTMAPRPRPAGNSQWTNSPLPPRRSRSTRPINPTGASSAAGAMVQTAASSSCHRSFQRAIFSRAVSVVREPGRFQCWISGSRHDCTGIRASLSRQGRRCMPPKRAKSGCRVCFIRPGGTTGATGGGGGPGWVVLPGSTAGEPISLSSPNTQPAPARAASGYGRQRGRRVRQRRLQRVWSQMPPYVTTAPPTAVAAPRIRHLRRLRRQAAAAPVEQDGDQAPAKADRSVSVRS